jgi:hypothetical protein
MKSMRLEYKFLIPESKIDQVRESLLPFIVIDEYAAAREQKEYTVRSIYFDSNKLDDYRDKLAGLKIRKKLRIRGYNLQNEDSIIFLEVKRKYENNISKNRSPLLYTDLNELFLTNDFEKLLLKRKNYLNAYSDAVKFFYTYKSKNYLPVVLVVYEREAFFSKHDSTLRITFDKNLRSKPLPIFDNLYEEADLKKSMQGNFILEIKFFNGFPQWLQSIVSRFNLQRKAISKYTISVDNHYELKKYIYDKRILIPSLIDGVNFKAQKDLLKNVG